jgi:hypothetical protein
MWGNTPTENPMQKWMYLRLAVNYRGESEVYSATSNGTPVFNSTEDIKRTAQDLQDYVEQLGLQGWELVNVYQDSQLCEIYHFKRPIE